MYLPSTTKMLMFGLFQMFLSKKKSNMLLNLVMIISYKLTYMSLKKQSYR